MFTENKIVKTGDDDFHWFFGVVEDIDDPLKLGRVRVRVVGDHTQHKQSRIPTEGLPWAIHIVSSPNTQMNGMGSSPTTLYKGTWVVGFYIDGPNKQMPLIFGSFGGVPRGLPDGDIGFNDSYMRGVKNLVKPKIISSKWDDNKSLISLKMAF